MSNRKFAYGDDMVPDDDGVQCPCPATAAGFAPRNGDYVTEIAEWYDEILREIYGGDTDRFNCGVVDESTARNAWMEAIDRYTETERGSRRGSILRSDPPDAVLREAREVADELGWN